MGTLSSRLFVEGDPATVKKLEDCATGRPTEVISHFSQTANRNGEHVRRVQLALKQVQDRNPELAIPSFDVNGVYDAKFAKAIAVYKERRGIKNYANRIDDIVGIKTIRSLDKDVNRPVPTPPPPPSPPPAPPPPAPAPPAPLPTNCLVEAECPTNTVFDIQMIVGGSGGEIIEGGLFAFMITDLENRLSCPYSLFTGGLGTPGLPITPAGGGKPSRFRTPVPVKVTSFGPVGGLSSVTVGLPGTIAGPNNVTLFSVLTFGYRKSMSLTPDGMITINPFDTGPINIQGAGIQLGRFKCLGLCKGGLGAGKI